jgi:hypothetical protein
MVKKLAVGKPFLLVLRFSPVSSIPLMFYTRRSQWPRGLRRGSAAVRLLGLWIRIPPGAWMSVSFECCVLSGRGLCVGLITSPEESYRVRCVLSECDHEASIMRRPWPYKGCYAIGKKMFHTHSSITDFIYSQQLIASLNNT